MQVSQWKQHIVHGFDPESVIPSDINSIQWSDLSGNIASAPDYEVLPDPEAVLHGELNPDFENLRVRSDKTFVAGCLPHFIQEWQKSFAGIPGFSDVKAWLDDGVNFYDFFTHYSGVYRGRKFDSVIPPHMYSSYYLKLHVLEETISKKIMKLET